MSADLGDLRLEAFAALVGSAFTVDGRAMTLEEAEAVPGGTPSRPAFSLVFRGPQEPRLPQGVYAVAHEATGELEIFLVPIAPGRYQAIFA